MKKNIIKELSDRGLIQDIIPGTEEQLLKEMTSCYVGFDPTAESLHIGSMLPIILLMHLQQAGHKPYALVGGATGMIGDPTGKSAERNLLDESTLQKNVQGIEAQLSKFLNFDSSIPNAAELINNYDWMKDFSFLGFIRDIGKHISVNYMMAKDSVQRRLEFGLSFTEFSYQLLQGYDFLHLYQTKNIKLQFGGADQWGNITTGTELIRRKAQGEAYAFTCPLLKKADGGKFGKTEGGNIWLDKRLTSPFQFYQYWLNVSDEDAKHLIKVFTFLDLDTIASLTAQHDEAPHLRLLQKRLAEEMTVLVHSREDYEFSLKATELLFGNATKELLLSMKEDELLQTMAGVPQFTITYQEIADGTPMLDFLTHGSIYPSKGEARKAIQSNAVSINKEKWDASKTHIDAQSLLLDKYILVQKGKKNYYLATVIR